MANQNRMIYALYKGDTNIADGTAFELAKQLGVQAKTIRYMATKAHRKRVKSSGDAMFAIKIGRIKEIDRG